MDEAKEIDILNESIALLQKCQFALFLEGKRFIGPGATERFNAYETLNGAIIHLRKQRAALEWNRMMRNQ